MGQIGRYRVRCTTDSKYEYEWSETEPTVCPVNGAHTIDATQTACVETRPALLIAMDAHFEAVLPDAANVVANDRPAIEVQTAADGFGAASTIWPCAQNNAANVEIQVGFILKALGTGLTARLMAKVKAEGAGDDSSEAFTATGTVDVSVTHTTLGEVFEGSIKLDASTFNEGDAVAIHIGREGTHANDVLNQAIQIIGTRIEAN